MRIQERELSDHEVIGAAVIHHGRLFVARRTTPTEAAGHWELPGDVQKVGEDDLDTLRRVFNDEFSRSISLRVDRILPDRLIGTWRMSGGNSVPANLHAVRCQLLDVLPEDIEVGIPLPNQYHYDLSAWVRIEDLDAVGPWRYADRMMAADIADYYSADPDWQSVG